MDMKAILEGISPEADCIGITREDVLLKLKELLVLIEEHGEYICEDAANDGVYPVKPTPEMEELAGIVERAVYDVECM